MLTGVTPQFINSLIEQRAKVVKAIDAIDLLLSVYTPQQDVKRRLIDVKSVVVDTLKNSVQSLTFADICKEIRAKHNVGTHAIKTQIKVLLNAGEIERVLTGNCHPKYRYNRKLAPQSIKTL